MADKEAKIKVKVEGAEQAQSKLGSLASTIKSGFASLPIIGASFASLGVTLTKASKEAADAELNVKQLNAALKSTGRESEISVDELTQYASALQATTTASDDAVMQAQALLLRFRRISTEIMPDVIKSALDVSAALNQELTPTVEQLGRALESPINAGRALRSMNIILTQSQEDLIKKLAESGDIIGAQRAILRELSTAYNDAEKSKVNSFSGSWKRLGNSIGEVLEVIGGFVNMLTGPFVRAIATGLLAITSFINTSVESYRKSKDDLKIINDDITKQTESQIKKRLTVEEKLLQEAKDNQKMYSDAVKTAKKEGAFALEESSKQSEKYWSGEVTRLSKAVEKTKEFSKKMQDAKPKQAIETDESAEDRKTRLQKEAQERLSLFEIEEQKKTELARRGRERRIEDDIDENMRLLKSKDLTIEQRAQLELKGIQLQNQLIIENEKRRMQAIADIQTSFDNLEIIATATKSRELFDIAKAGSIATATMKAYEAFNTSLASAPFPFNLVGAGAALATGLGTVASISSQNPKFARGGEFETSGPQTARTTSGQTALMGEAGKERVSVEPIGKPSSAAPSNINLTINLDGRTVAKQIYPYIKAIDRGTIR